jgi:hypothetical protein
MGCSLLLIATQSGCSTVLGTVDSEDEQFRCKVFVGIRVAGLGMTGHVGEVPLECMAPCFLVDSIPSLAADIVLLPFTLIYELFRSKEPWKKQNPSGP